MKASVLPAYLTLAPPAADSLRQEANAFRARAARSDFYAAHEPAILAAAAERIGKLRAFALVLAADPEAAEVLRSCRLEITEASPGVLVADPLPLAAFLDLGFPDLATALRAEPGPVAAVIGYGGVMLRPLTLAPLLPTSSALN